jgi:ribosomal protein L7Ae-like RNA K-turn-binding protein
VIDQPFIDDVPFSEPHIVIVEGAQRSGKSVYAVATVIDAYRKDCIRIFCEQVLKIKCIVKAYYPKERIAKIKINGQAKLIRIPEDYKLKSSMRIFSNIHLYGVPYVYVPSFTVLADWLKRGIVSNGYLIMDEAHVGMSARGGMTKLGKDLVTQCMQFGKSKLDVLMITHMPRLIDWVGRTIPTKQVSCSYNAKNHKVEYSYRKKGIPGVQEHSFDASQYFGNYRSNEKVNQ